ncbi:MAG: hypothetical protein AAF944_16720 [Bacteroidota bacterium]
MKKLSSVMLVLVCALSVAHAQSSYISKLKSPKKSDMTFYKDANRSEEITKIAPGQTEFYAVMPLSKKDFKVIGKFYAVGSQEMLEATAQVRDLKSGVAKKTIKVYYSMPNVGKPLKELASDEGEVMVHFKLDSKENVNFMSRVEETVKFGGDKVHPLTVELGFGREPLGVGVIDWDLTDSGAAYSAASLASRANYTFTNSDAIDDPAFKAKVKQDIEQRLNVKIYHMAHGERVPYERDYKSYRRNSFAITYKDLDDGKCYTGGISAFEDGTYPNGAPYRYDNEGLINSGDEIPCDRVDK